MLFTPSGRKVRDSLRTSDIQRGATYGVLERSHQPEASDRLFDGLCIFLTKLLQTPNGLIMPALLALGRNREARHRRFRVL